MIVLQDPPLIKDTSTMDPRRLPGNIVIEVGRSYSDDKIVPSPESKSETALVQNDEEEHGHRSVWFKYQFTIIVVLMQVLFMVLMGFFGEYNGEAYPGDVVDPNAMNSLYSMFQDVHIMIFAGFGFLMTFLKRYGYSAVSINLLLASMTIEWGIVVRGLIYEGRHHDGRFEIGLETLLDGDFCAATVLISMGAMLGKLTPVQYIIMMFFEVPAAMGFSYVLSDILKINDVGDSLSIHCFGAYFGLACSAVFQKKAQREHPHEGSSYNSDLFSMIGTIFLWCFWPSFNGATASPADAKIRAISNTYLSLVASTVATFVISQVTDKHGKFDMIHIANATLAGGVAIGTNANSVLDPLDAMIIGVVAGLISTLGFRYLTPLMSKLLGIHDTCGVNNLHGMPAIVSGISACIFAVRYDIRDYGVSVMDIYPAIERRNDGTWNVSDVALYQLYGLLVVLGAGITTGAITGLILRLPVWEQLSDEDNFSDQQFFETPSDFAEAVEKDLA